MSNIYILIKPIIIALFTFIQKCKIEKENDTL